MTEWKSAIQQESQNGALSSDADDSVPLEDGTTHIKQKSQNLAQARHVDTNASLLREFLCEPDIDLDFLATAETWAGFLAMDF